MPRPPKPAIPPSSAAAVPDRWVRLDAFLARLKADVYPEPPSGAHGSITARVYQRLTETRPLPAGARVLDVGCGQGPALALFRRDGHHATGITLGEDVEICRAAGYDVQEMDLHFLDFPDGSFDLVWCRHAIEHSVMPYFTLSEIFRVLKPGGTAYIEVPAPDTACRHQANPNHYSVLGKSMWLALMYRSGFADIDQFDIGFNVPVGPDQYWGFILRRPAA
jgi:SAM-dependent methyltransferase